MISVPNTATNVIPAEACAKLNIRYNDLWTRPKGRGLRARARGAGGGGGVEPGSTSASQAPAMCSSTKPGPLLETMFASVKAVTGKTPVLSTGGGTSDARFIHFHCPVIEFGLINETIHQVNERCPVADLLKLTEVYADFLKRFFKPGSVRLAGRRRAANSSVVCAS